MNTFIEYEYDLFLQVFILAEHDYLVTSLPWAEVEAMSTKSIHSEKTSLLFHAAILPKLVGPWATSCFSVCLTTPVNCLRR